MALVIIVTPGAQLGEDEEITREVLNRLGLPTISLEGLVDQVVIADEAVTTPKLADEAVTGPKLALLIVGDGHIAEDAAIALRKLAAGAAHQIVACLPGGALQFATGIGEVGGQTCKQLPFDNMVAGGLSAGQTVRGKTSEETGMVAAIEMVGASDGYLILKDCSGDTWADNEDLEVLNEVEYDGLVDGKSFTAGDAVLGAASGATGIILSKTGTRLVLRRNTGTWEEDEGIRVNGDATNTALVNGPHAVRAKVDFSGDKEFGDAAYYALAVDRLIHGAELHDRAVPTSKLRPEGTAGQMLVSRGLQLPPQFQTVAWKPSAMVTATTGTAKSWALASHSAENDTITFGAGVDMAEIANGDVVCFSGAVLPGGVSRGTRYYVGNKDAEAKTCKLYTDAGLTALVDITGGGALANNFAHQQIATGHNAALFEDSNDAGTLVGRYQMIFLTPLTTGNLVLTGRAWGIGGDNAYPAHLSEVSAATGLLRFRSTDYSGTHYDAYRMRLAVFENP